MKDALAFHQQILQHVDAKDPAIRFDTSSELGTLSTSRMEPPDQAERLVRQALELVEGLRSEQPQNTEYLGLQVMCFLRLGAYLETLRRPDEALAASERSIQQAELLARATPDDLSHQELVAVCHAACANRLRQFKRLRDARVHYLKAIEIRQQLDPANYAAKDPELEFLRDRPQFRQIIVSDAAKP